jgi:hypothetical protein
MNTVKLFNQFNPKVYTGFDVLKNKCLTPSPVKYVSDTSDYSQATEFYGLSDFVFLVKHGTKVLETFPLWFKPPVNESNVAYEFPVAFKETKNVKSWGDVALVPSDGIVTSVKRKENIVSYYDLYNGKLKFDVFFIGNSGNKNYDKLKSITDVIAVDNIDEARAVSSTEMFWIVPDNVCIVKGFIFDFKPNERASGYPHVFGNGEIMRHDGIVLMPRSYIPTETEVKNNFYAKKRIIREIASYPE